MAANDEVMNGLINGVDFKLRRIYFGVPIDWTEESAGDFTQASVEIATRALHKMAAEAPGKPIEIHMNSYGGDPYAMLRLYDEILSCPCQVKFYGGGAIMSAATWIMVACDERYLHKHATVMVHDGSEEYGGKHTDVQITAAEMKRLQDILYDIYSSNTRMPKEFWQDVCQRDLYLSASEAVSLGMADKLLEPKKRGNLRKVRQAAMKASLDGDKMKSLISSLYQRINKVKIPKIKLNTVEKEPIDPSVFISDLQEEKTASISADADKKETKEQ